MARGNVKYFGPLETVRAFVRKITNARTFKFLFGNNSSYIKRDSSIYNWREIHGRTKVLLRRFEGYRELDKVISIPKLSNKNQNTKRAQRSILKNGVCYYAI